MSLQTFESKGNLGFIPDSIPLCIHPLLRGVLDFPALRVFRRD